MIAYDNENFGRPARRPGTGRGLPGRRKVLIVEDDAWVALATLNLLQTMKMTVCAASSAEEALTRAAEHQPDIAIMDIRLKEGDGIEAAQVIQRSFATSILFASAYCRDYLDRLPADSLCLPKPFGMDDLAAAMAAVWRLRAGEDVPEPLPGGMFRVR
jgi:CheY-like chemotaxis protein